MDTDRSTGPPAIMDAPHTSPLRTPRGQDRSHASHLSAGETPAAPTASPPYTSPTPPSPQQQLYSTQAELLRCRVRLASAQEEVAEVRLMLTAAEAEGRASRSERDEARERLRLSQDGLERARREAAAGSLLSVTLTAERDDLAQKLREAWERVGSLRSQLATAEEARGVAQRERELAVAAVERSRGGGEDAPPEAAALRAAREEAAALRAALAESEARHAAYARDRRAGELRERQTREDEQQAWRAAAMEAVTRVADTLDRVRTAGARALLPLDCTLSTHAAEAHAEAEAAVVALEQSAASSPDLAPHRALVGTARAWPDLLTTLHAQVRRVAEAQARADRERVEAVAEVQQLQRALAEVQRQRGELQQSLGDYQRRAAAAEGGALQEGLAARAALAADLNCAEDWSLVRYRVRHVQQQLEAWECEVRRMQGQWEAAQAGAEAQASRVDAEHRAEVAGLTAQLRARGRELEQLKDAHAALQLEHQYGGSSLALATVEGTRVRRAVGEEPPSPSSTRLAQALQEARAESARLARDKEQLYSIVDMLRRQLRELRTQGGDAGGPANAPTQRQGGGGGAVEGRASSVISESSTGSSAGSFAARRSGTAEPHREEEAAAHPPRRREHTDGGVSSENVSLHHTPAPTTGLAEVHRHSTLIAAHPPPSGAGDSHSHGPQPKLQPLAPSVPYPPPVLPSHAAALSRQETEEVLLRSVHQDHRASAYAAGVVGGWPPATVSTTGKFATEVLGVIEALDRRVTGALQ